MALKDPDVSSLKEKQLKALGKIKGEYAGYMNYIPMLTEVVQKVEAIASLIAGLDKKDAVTSADVRIVEENIVALKVSVEQTKQKVKDQLKKFVEEANIFYAQRDKDLNSVDPNFEKSKRKEINAFKNIAYEAETRFERSVAFFECCCTGLKKACVIPY